MASPSTPQAPPLGSVLVTGGCGFLGSHIVSLLLSRHASPATSVSIIDLRTTTNRHAGAQYHDCDLTDLPALRRLLDEIRPDVVIHTASPVLSNHSAAYRKLMWKINVQGTRDLVEECRTRGTKAFVYTSSASVVSDTKTDLVNADEEYGVVRGKLQREYYTDTKAEAEQLVLASNTRPTSTTPAFLTCAIRPSAIFGEGDVQSIPNMLAVLRTGRTKYQLGDNENLFDFTYVGNVAHAHLLAARRLLETHGRLTASPGADDVVEGARVERRVDGEAFFITNASPIYFWDFARYVWHRYHALATTTPSSSTNIPPPPPSPATPAETRRLPRELALFIAGALAWIWWLLRLAGGPSITPTRVTYACMTRYFSTKKAERGLGYTPVWGLEEGVERTVGWFLEREREGVAKTKMG